MIHFLLLASMALAGIAVFLPRQQLSRSRNNLRLESLEEEVCLEDIGLDEITLDTGIQSAAPYSQPYDSFADWRRDHALMPMIVIAIGVLFAATFVGTLVAIVIFALKK